MEEQNKSAGGAALRRGFSDVLVVSVREFVSGFRLLAGREPSSLHLQGDTREGEGRRRGGGGEGRGGRCTCGGDQRASCSEQLSLLWR